MRYIHTMRATVKQSDHPNYNDFEVDVVWQMPNGKDEQASARVFGEEAQHRAPASTYSELEWLFAIALQRIHRVMRLKEEELLSKNSGTTHDERRNDTP